MTLQSRICRWPRLRNGRIGCDLQARYRHAVSGGAHSFPVYRLSDVRLQACVGQGGNFTLRNALGEGDDRQRRQDTDER